MRVKKPQSKRKSTRLEKGIQKKVAAHNRKQRKLAKKDPTWKSKHKKDPGIPNSFPFKQQLLEEIEMKKQQELQRREQRRQEARLAALSQGATEADLANIEQGLDVQDNQDRLSALMESAQAAAESFDGFSDEDMSDDDDDDSEEDEQLQQFQSEFEQIKSDTSRKAFDKHFKSVVENCDIILYVLDARNPNGYRSKHVERLVLAHPNKKLVFVLNKVDLVPTETLKGWIKHLQLSFPTIPMIGGAAAPNAHKWTHKGFSDTPEKLLEALKKYANNTQLKRAVTVGVVGYPNTGKSSIINSLLGTRGGNKSMAVGANAGVTTQVSKVKIDNKLSLLDCPGIVFPTSSTKGKSSEDENARLILLNSLPLKFMVDCRPAVKKLVKRLMKDPEQMKLFEDYYDIPAIPRDPLDQYVTNMLVHVARKLGRMGKHGIPNLDSAAQAVVMDWRDGRVSGWIEPPAEKPVDTNVEVVNEWSKELNLDDILSGLL